MSEIVKEVTIFVNCTSCDIDFINKIIEGYEGIALVSTVNSSKALLKIQTSTDLVEEVIVVLKSIPRELTITQII
ncbi:MAG: DUF4911 domain-containing protein [Bacillota bacterium]